MRIRPLAASLVLLAVVTAIAVQAPAQNPGGERPRGRRDRPAIELKNFTFQLQSFASEAVGKPMPFGVYLPKDYDAKEHQETRWPLVVWLHGMFEDHQSFHARDGAPMLDKAVSDGLLPPCVFVLADGGRTSMYINAGEKRNWQDLVQKDLLQHIGKTYRVTAERQQRALMGISMGGMASLRIGFTHPELFGTVAVHSSAVFPADPTQLPPNLLRRASQFGLDEVFGNPLDAKLWQATNPLGIAAGLDPKTLAGLRLYFDAGTKDRFEFGPTNQLLHEVLETRKVPHTFDLVEGGGHAWNSGFKNESLLASLKFVGDGFRAAAGKGAGLHGLAGELGGQNGDGKGPAPGKKDADGGR